MSLKERKRSEASYFPFLFLFELFEGEDDGLRRLRRESMAEQRGGGSETGKLGEKGDIDLNQVFADNGRDLNQLFPDLSLKSLLKEIEENKREVKAFLKALEIEDEGNG